MLSEKLRHLHSVVHACREAGTIFDDADLRTIEDSLKEAFCEALSLEQKQKVEVYQVDFMRRSKPVYAPCDGGAA